MSADAVLAPRARLAVLILGLLLAAGAVHAFRQETIAAPGWLAEWTARHPDPRTFTAEESAALAGLQGRARRTDVLCLLSALAGGCLLLAAWPALAARAGGARVAVLAGGSVALGVVLAGVSLAGQAGGARTGQWTLGDDALGALAGPQHAATLRAFRESVPEGDAVLLLGTDSQLWSLTAWALHPRAIYPVLREVPPEWTDAALVEQLRTLELGRGHGGRWAVDLGALAAPERCAHGALLRVDP